MVVTWNIAQDCVRKHERAIERLIDYLHKNSERFKLRSLRYFSETVGGSPFSPRRVMIFEYGSSEDLEYSENKMREDKELAGINSELWANVHKRTRRVLEWQDKQRDSWFG